AVGDRTWVSRDGPARGVRGIRGVALEPGGTAPRAERRRLEADRGPPQAGQGDASLADGQNVRSRCQASHAGEGCSRIEWSYKFTLMSPNGGWARVERRMRRSG